MKKKENLAVTELKQMLPTIGLLNGIMLVVIGIYGLFKPIGWTVFTGAIVGNAIAISNFLLLGYTANKALERKQEKKARFTANLSYGSRYLGTFAVLAVCLMFKVIGIIPAVLPLFFPRIYYLIYYTFHKADENQQKE